MRFEQQVAVITGAATGLGRAYALALAERGAKIVLLDSESMGPGDSRLRSCAAAVIALGGEAIAYTLDVSDYGAAAEVIDRVIQHWGRVDILINNAGIHQVCDFEHLTESMWKRQLDVDLNGSFNLTKAVWPIMKRRGYGRIMMSAASAVYGDMHETSYGACKMALIGLVNSLHIEGDEHNIRVNSIIPHAVTDMTAKHLAPAVRPLFSKTTVTACMLFLCSSKAPSGQHILAAAGSISHGEFVEFYPSQFSAEESKPESLIEEWPHMFHARPITTHSSGEAQVLSWARCAAEKRHIEIE